MWGAYLLPFYEYWLFLIHLGRAKVQKDAVQAESVRANQQKKTREEVGYRGSATKNNIGLMRYNAVKKQFEIVSL